MFVLYWCSTGFTHKPKRWPLVPKVQVSNPMISGLCPLGLLFPLKRREYRLSIQEADIERDLYKLEAYIHKLKQPKRFGQERCGWISFQWHLCSIEST